MTKLRVPQAKGEITIAVGGQEPTTYKVTNHEVTVEEPDVDRFLSQVDGSELTGGSPAASPPKES